MKCKECGYEGEDFYVSNKSLCKDCVKKSVRENRKINIEYYRQYDAHRFKNDPKVRARHIAYQQTEAGKESIRKSNIKWQENNLLKRAANVIVGNAVRDGRLTKESCESCETDKNIHGHHDNYSKPLDVRWLCAACHRKWHDENGPVEV